MRAFIIQKGQTPLIKKHNKPSTPIPYFEKFYERTATNDVWI